MSEEKEESKSELKATDSEKDDVSANNLQFQEFADSEATTIPLGAGEIGDAGIQSSRGVPTSFESDDEQVGSSSNLLPRKRTDMSWWTFEYYTQFFDVSTSQVTRRIFGSILPSIKANYLREQIRNNPDFYGPFWVCATLVFTTAISGNLADYITHEGVHQWKYDFHKVTAAAGVIYMYAWLVPVLLWGLLWWRHDTVGATFTELICIYGYSLSIYIPISVLWTIPFEWLRWALVVTGAALSGFALVTTIWPLLRHENRQVSMLITLIVFALHALLGIGFKLYFFGSIRPTASGNSTGSVAYTIASTASDGLLTDLTTDKV